MKMPKTPAVSDRELVVAPYLGQIALMNKRTNQVVFILHQRNLTIKSETGEAVFAEVEFVCAHPYLEKEDEQTPTD